MSKRAPEGSAAAGEKRPKTEVGGKQLSGLKALLQSKIGSLPPKKSKNGKPGVSKAAGAGGISKKFAASDKGGKFGKKFTPGRAGQHAGKKGFGGKVGKGGWVPRGLPSPLDRRGGEEEDGGGEAAAAKGSASRPAMHAGNPPKNQMQQDQEQSASASGGQGGAGAGGEKRKKREEIKAARTQASEADRGGAHAGGANCENSEGGKGSEAGTAAGAAAAKPVSGVQHGTKASSNWMAMKEQLKQQKLEEKASKNKAGGNKDGAMPRGGKDSRPGYILPTLAEAKAGNFIGPIAMDCEMVGVGEDGSKSVLARVSIVDFHGNVLIDSYVAPQEKVTDLRTWVSGIRWQDLKGAPKFADVQKIVGHITDGAVLVGHALRNDLEALLLKHPSNMIRDTAKYKPFMRMKRSRKLRDLCKEELGLAIQTGEHSSVEDARSALLLYKQVRTTWEAECETMAKKKAKFSKKKQAKAQDGDDE
jgi:RNA exonuclease 4